MSTSIEVEPIRFSGIDISSITKLVKRKDQRSLEELGGVAGVATALETNVEDGINGDEDDISSREKAFGSNVYGKKQPAAKTFSEFALDALIDPMILILLSCALLSIGFGIRNDGLREGWKNGAIALAAVLAIIIISAISNFWPDKQFQKLSKASSMIPQVDVVRHGQSQRIPISNVVVGDVVFLMPGDRVPADGLFLRGISIQVENLLNGRAERLKVDSLNNLFLFSGTSVVHGHAQMLVTAVGKNRKSHIIHLDGRLIDQCENLTSFVGKAGRAVAFLVLLVVLVRFFAGNIYNETLHRVPGGGEMKFLDVVAALVGIATTPVMIALASTPKDLLLAVKIYLAYSMKRMMDADVLLKRPSLCHVIGQATTICTNITGSLTTDTKEVTKFWLGLSSIEGVPCNLIAPYVLELLHQGTGLNTSLPPSKLSESPLKTEKAIFDWAVQKIGMDIEALKKSCTIIGTEYFNPENKQSGVLIQTADKSFHVHRKGEPDVILRMCSQYYETTGIVKAMNKIERELLEHTIEGMAKDGLRCIALAHKKISIEEFFTSSPPTLILLGLVGLRSSLRPGVKKALNDCIGAGVTLKLITGDSMFTASNVATECGILEAGKNQHNIVVEGQEFRNYTSEERLEKVDYIRVMARATPLDKFLFVQCLKDKGNVVAFLGRGIGDVRALQEADIGLCFGSRSAEMAKACSEIIILNNEFPSAVDILRWGRGTYDGIQAYTEYLLTASFVALIIDSVMEISPRELRGVHFIEVVSEGKSPFPVFQLVWLKLILGTVAALTLVVKQPPGEIMHKPPRDRKEPLINNIMIRNILVQSLYQVATLLTIHFKGNTLFKVSNKVQSTMISHTYFLCQVFNMFTVRSFEQNFFEEIQRKKLVWAVNGITVVIQALMVQVFGRYSDTARLDTGQWGICIAIAAISWPISWLVKYIPILNILFFRNVRWPIYKSKVK
ncbi:hypothetical protein RJ640_011480 [Escallonia rubra]|uniref:Calcium-transporting ATPase n=1 Tax=Escallonia rubra TaxID=112253 RepID=A0AA88UMG6_9ASTE|nr:hypothetical protein RJ640_011480 [Escallonia rubra]